MKHTNILWKKHLRPSKNRLPEEKEYCQQDYQIAYPCPPGGVPRRTNRDIQLTFHIAHRTIVLQHAHAKCITAWRQRHIGNIRIVRRRLDPLVIETLQLIDKPRTIVYTAIVGGHVDRELILTI